jgi:hypothetical protein
MWCNQLGNKRCYILHINGVFHFICRILYLASNTYKVRASDTESIVSTVCACTIAASDSLSVISTFNPCNLSQQYNELVTFSSSRFNMSVR